MSPAPASMISPRALLAEAGRYTANDNEEGGTPMIRRQNRVAPIPIRSGTAQRPVLPQSEEDMVSDDSEYDGMPDLVPVSVSSWYDEEPTTDPTLPFQFPNDNAQTYAPLLLPLASSSYSRPNSYPAPTSPPRARNDNFGEGTVSHRIQTISRYYVDWLATVQTLQSRYLEHTSLLDRHDPSYTTSRQRALSELNTALAETESLTARLSTLANDLELAVDQTWPESPSSPGNGCVYPVVNGNSSNRLRWNMSSRNLCGLGREGFEVDYEGLLKEGKVDRNGVEVMNQGQRMLMEVDR